MPLIIKYFYYRALMNGFSVVKATSRCLSRLSPRVNSSAFARLASEPSIRSTVLSPNRAPGCRLGVLLILMLIQQMLGLPALAQQRNLSQGNLDYYAPRAEGNESQLFNNVIGHHLAPGREQMQRGEYVGALAHFEFILRYYPNHPQTLAYLSELCLKWKSPICDGAADMWFPKAIAINPGAAQSYVVQALHLHRKNKLDDAVKSYQRAVELAPNSINAHYNLGLAYSDLKQYDQANLHAQKSYALGVTLPGLRARLEKVGKWNSNVSLPESEPKPAAEPASPVSPEKTPD